MARRTDDISVLVALDRGGPQTLRALLRRAKLSMLAGTAALEGLGAAVRLTSDELYELTDLGRQAVKTWLESRLAENRERAALARQGRWRAGLTVASATSRPRQGAGLHYRPRGSATPTRLQWLANTLLDLRCAFTDEERALVVELSEDLKAGQDRRHDVARLLEWVRARLEVAHGEAQRQAPSVGAARTWTTADEAALLALRAANPPWTFTRIGPHLGRTPDACRTHFYRLQHAGAGENACAS